MTKNTQRNLYIYADALTDLPTVSRAAQAIYDKAGSREGLVTHFLWQFGKFRFLKRYFMSTLQIYEQAAVLDPQCARIRTALGIGYARVGSFRRAKHHFEIALQLAPNNAWVNACLAKMYGDLGETGLADEYWSKAEVLGTRLRRLDKSQRRR